MELFYFFNFYVVGQGDKQKGKVGQDDQHDDKVGQSGQLPPPTPNHAEVNAALLVDRILR